MIYFRWGNDPSLALWLEETSHTPLKVLLSAKKTAFREGGQFLFKGLTTSATETSRFKAGETR